MSAQTSKEFDVVIIGGGLVGASLACALASAKLDKALSIAVVEAYEFKHYAQPSFDSRTVALSYSSKKIFQTLNLWDDIVKQGACAIKDIHVSDRGHLGLSHLSASQQGKDALGYVVENQHLGQALHHKMAEQSNITLYCPATLNDFKLNDRHAEVEINCQQTEKTLSLKCRLLVAADGGQSIVREQADVATRNLAYNQTAVITNIACDKAHNNVAYERFTDSGPLALLPLNDCDDTSNRYSLVWTLTNDQFERCLQLDDNEFLAALQQRFGNRAGRFIKTGKRVSYPLSLIRARQSIKQRLAIIGNAAHTLHPVAGQGFNLGLRDVASLAQIIVIAQRHKNDFGEDYYLKQYQSWRQRDLIQTSMATDSLVRLFTTKFLPLVVVRNMALLAFDMFPGIKKRIGRQAMGFVGKASRLARGLPL